MSNSEKLCMGCMQDIGDEVCCPHCGYIVGTPQIVPYLPVRTVVANRYIVGKLLEYNGDGATYIAWDNSDQRPVKIREFLPQSLCGRKPGDKQVMILAGCELTFNDCMSDFLELWRKLTRMSGLSALETVYDVFEENLTAYAVSEYVESISLRDYLLRSKAGYVSWERARSLFMPVLSTLGMLHTAGIIHRGISPVTLQIGRDAKMRIGGFSIWQARTAKSDLTAQLFPGYAAVEQYGFEGKQGPWTDIYSFAATLYRALIGTDPIEATQRLTNDRLMVPAKFAEKLPAYVINGLINALQILPEDRTNSVEQLRAELSASPTATVLSDMGSTTTIQPVKREPVRRPNPERQQPERRPVQNRPVKKKKKKSALAGNKLLIIRTTLISAIVCLLVFLVVVLAAGDKLGLSVKDPDQAEATTRDEEVAVPYLINRNYSEVMSIPFWTNDFQFEKVEQYSDTVAKGLIIEQSIPAETMVNAGSKIVLTVSLGKEQFKLPNIVGMYYEDAKTLLHDSNFKVVKKTEENDGSHEEDRVKEILELTPGQSYDKGTDVVLVVWGAAPDEPEEETTTRYTATAQPTQPSQSVTPTAPQTPATQAPDTSQTPETQAPTQAPTEAPTQAPSEAATTGASEDRGGLLGLINEVLG